MIHRLIYFLTAIAVDDIVYSYESQQLLKYQVIEIEQIPYQYIGFAVKPESKILNLMQNFYMENSQEEIKYKEPKVTAVCLSFHFVSNPLQ